MIDNSNGKTRTARIGLIMINDLVTIVSGEFLPLYTFLSSLISLFPFGPCFFSLVNSSTIVSYVVKVSIEKADRQMDHGTIWYQANS